MEPPIPPRCNSLAVTPRNRVILPVTAAIAAAAITAAHAAQSSKAPRAPHATCATQSLAAFPGAFASRRNLVVGPLSLVGAGGTPRFVWNSDGREGFQKFPLLVKAGHRVTLELPPRTRHGAGLAYGPLPQGEIHLRDTHRVVTFVACTRGQPQSRADGQPVTFWSGGVNARTPRCVPLLVWVDSEHSPRRAVIHLGVRRCA
jgi:hypothetical protein